MAKLKLQQKETIKKALVKSKKLEREKDLYTIRELKEEDSSFIEQAKKLPAMMSKLLIRRRPKKK